MDNEIKSGLQTMLEDAVVKRLQDLFNDEEEGLVIINRIRDKVLSEVVDIEDIKKNFGM
jgi:hypothetical protein